MSALNYPKNLPEIRKINILGKMSASSTSQKISSDISSAVGGSGTSGGVKDEKLGFVLELVMPDLH
uniref:Uncharacterized protein n=1 Tax=Romanomermis culicivorax TaxID=13658 RepID=A0A915HNN4_ROMCU